jgi:probable HAF family extracellular repeat protein
MYQRQQTLKEGTSMKHYPMIALAACATILTSMPASAFNDYYAVTDLGVFGDSPYGFAINSGGQITGWAQTGGGTYRGFVAGPGSAPIDIGSLGGASTYGYGINDLAQVTGASEVGPNMNSYHAFVYSPGAGMVDIGTLGGTESLGFDINNKGQVAGFSSLANNFGVRGFIYTPGTGMTEVGTLGGQNSFTTGINDAGQFTGYADVDSSQTRHAYLGSSAGLSDLGTLGGSESYGAAISENGFVAGASYLPGDSHFHAFLFREGLGMLDLGSDVPSGSSSAHGVNSSGQVVGVSDMEIGEVGFVYRSDLGYRRLNSVVDASGNGWFFREGLAINEAGQITGVGTKDGVGHVFLLTPIVHTIPEPSTHVLFLAGLTFLAWRLRLARSRDAGETGQ